MVQSYQPRSYCGDCALPNEVSRIRSKMLVVERDIVNVASELRATTTRLEGLVATFGEQLGRMAALTETLIEANKAKKKQKVR